MAFDAGTAQGKLELDTAGFESAVKRSLTAVAGLVIAAKGIAAAFSGAAKFISEGVTLQAEYERSVVALSSTLKNEGVRNFEAITKQVEEFAGALQRATGIDDRATIGVAQRLAQLGVEAQKLVPATKVVQDFAAAFGVDSAAAASAFGRALNGNAKALAKYVPEVRNLTKAQLEAGAAFDLVGKKVEGQAEILGNTFSGRLARLSESFEDFQMRVGAALTEAFGPLVTEVQAVLDELTDRLGAGQEGFSLLQAAAQSAASIVRTSFEVAISVGLRVAEVYNGLKSVILQVAAAANSFVGGFVGALGGAIQQIAGLLGQLASAAQFVGLQGLADSLRGVQDTAQNLATTFKEVERSQDGIATGLERSADAAGAASVRAGQLRAEVEAARANGASLAQQVGIVANRMGLTANAAGAAKRSLAEMAGTAGSAARAASANLELWRKVNEAADSTSGAVAQTASETERAAAAADEFASSMGAAAGAASRAAASASAASGGFGGGGGSGADAFGRRSGGSFSLDFSDPFRAVQQAEAAQAARRGVGANTFTGNTVRNAARLFAEGVTAKAQGVVDAALADFTSTILQELNQQGVSDPTERNRILRARISEAKRFGIIPTLGPRAQGSILGGF